jgi:hypothetical protein
LGFAVILLRTTNTSMAHESTTVYALRGYGRI